MTKYRLIQFLLLAIISLPTINAACDGTLMERYGLRLTKKSEPMSQGEADLRTRVVNAVLIAYEHLNSTATFHDNCKDPVKLPGGCWKELKAINLETREEHSILFPKGSTLKKSINSVFESNEPYSIDCQWASDFVSFIALNAAIPNEVDEILKRKEDELAISRSFSRRLLASSSYSAVGFKPGDLAYILGHPDYKTRHPYGLYRAENLYFVGYKDGVDIKGNAAELKMYMGFGEFFKDGPKTAADVQLHLTREHIKMSENAQLKSKEKQLLDMFRGMGIESLSIGELGEFPAELNEGEIFSDIRKQKTIFTLLNSDLFK